MPASNSQTGQVGEGISGRMNIDDLKPYLG